MLAMDRFLTHNGETLSVSEWSKRTGISSGTIRTRLNSLGYTVADALAKPVEKRFRPIPKGNAAAPKSAPRYLKDAAGNAFSRWVDSHTGKRVRKRWGKWGTVAAEQAYRRWAAEWVAGGGQKPVGVSVARLILSYVEWAAGHYLKNGKPTSEIHLIRGALVTVNELYGDTAATEFSPVNLMVVQSRWAERLTIITCNSYLSRVVRCWSWGVSRGMVPAATADALAHVPTLRAGRSKARLNRKKQPADDGDLNNVIEHIERTPKFRPFAGALRLQRLTGMRPGEVLEMRPRDIDRTSTPWAYVPPSGGKTLHHGKPRRVYLGPQARALLTPWLASCPADRRVWVYSTRGQLRPIQISYLRLVLRRSCVALGLPAITPHQLRHTYATAVQHRYENDAATGAAIGDSPEVARQVYSADPAGATARRVAEAMG
jgi:integrase